MMKVVPFVKAKGARLIGPNCPGLISPDQAKVGILPSTIVKKGKKAEVTFRHPAGLGQWYLSIGQGMGKALTFAEEKQGYVLADRGTYIKYEANSKGNPPLKILVEGDPILLNQYSVITVNPGNCKNTRNDSRDCRDDRKANRKPDPVLTKSRA